MTEMLAEELGRRVGEDGGVPAHPGLPANAESTALTLMALSVRPEGPGDNAAAAARWLIRHQASDGSWTFLPEVPVGTWPTALAALALATRTEGEALAAVETAVRRISDQEGRKLPWLTKVIYRFAPESMPVELNPSLNGWPWADGSFSWIEPTSYALLLLKRRGETATRRMRARVDEGERMILDRECVGGGWNYGNSRVLGEDLEPYPDTTALALLGLQGWDRTGAVEAGLAVLARQLGPHASADTLALAVLAGRAWATPVDEQRERLQEWARAGAYGGTRGIALASLALADQGNPFLLEVSS